MTDDSTSNESLDTMTTGLININTQLLDMITKHKNIAGKFLFVLIIFIIVISTLLIFTIGSNLYNLLTWHTVKEDSNLDPSEQRYLYISFIIGIICSSLALLFNLFILIIFWYFWKKQPNIPTTLP